jgi:hypothetical protein
MGEIRIAYKFWLEIMKGTYHSEYSGVYERTILKWVSRKLDGRVWTGLIWLRIDTDEGLY